MENKEKDGDTNESSILLQMPRSIFSFGDMSGNSFLMPVTSIETNDGVPSSTTEVPPETKDVVSKNEDLTKGPLCQLEQPLLMRKSSPAPQPQLPTVSQGYTLPNEQYPGGSFASNVSQDSFATAAVESNVAFPQLPTQSSLPPYSEAQSYFSHPEYYSQPSSTVPDYNVNSFVTGNSIPSSVTNNDRNILSPYESASHFYEPVKSYWLFQDIVESKEIWCGFSENDSNSLEEAFQRDPYGVVSTDGGRYDVDINKRIKKSVYFEAKDLLVRRCTWFYRTEGIQRFIPYEEDLAQMLEQHFYSCSVTGQWHKTLSLPESGIVMMESPQVILHYSKGVDVWPSIPDSRIKAKVAKRGLPEDVEFMPNESPVIDHLVFIVQGIGSFCDLRFRTVSQCVDGFRDIANRLIGSHFKHEVERGRVGRVEILPLAWHAKLHTSNIGLDRRMQSLTLPSIPKLRHFTNDTLLDILLYSSPSYCQAILDTVASELNTLSSLFIARNPSFCGKISVAGHSLGSLILFDILSHQPSCINEQEAKLDEISLDQCNDSNQYVIMEKNSGGQVSNDFTNVEALLEFLNLQEYSEIFIKEKIDLSTLPLLTETDLKELGLPKGPCKKLLNFMHSEGDELSAAKGQKEPQSLSVIENLEFIQSVNEETVPHASIFPEQPIKTSMSTIKYPRLHFEPACFFALGSPISMFLAVRGYESISEDFRFPTCPAFFHIFHPYDPVAFRIEPLIDPTFSAKPVLIPHHKGRKRMHIEIRENLTKVGSEIKQKVIETLRYTWNSLSGFAKAHSFPSAVMEAEVEKMVKEQMSSQSEDDVHYTTMSETSVEDIQIGNLNGGRRIDFVLQEKPIEALNDYIFALTSHATYWDSEDTVLMILREVYAMQGIEPLSLPENRSISPVPISAPRPAHLYQTSSGVHIQEPHKNPVEVIESVPPTSYSSYSDSPFIASSSGAFSGHEHNANISTDPIVPSSQPLAPPPLTGFVKKSPFSK